jgi:hypothetical protein
MDGGSTDVANMQWWYRSNGWIDEFGFPINEPIKNNYLAICAGGSIYLAGGACATSQGEIVPYAGLATPGKSAQIVVAINNTIDNYIRGVSYNIQINPFIGVGVSPESGYIPNFLSPSKNTWALTFGTTGASATYGFKPINKPN